ncbi:MAG: HEAT repeat domain-containing protein [Planctomycetes bacterium]|nr:HEAT repeat domain-containing protein [Planctomycetota bacterium]
MKQILFLPAFLAAALALAAAPAVRAEQAPAPPAPEIKVEKILGLDAAGWIKHLETHDAPEERRQAIYCLGDFGPAAAAAVPLLIKEALAGKDAANRKLSVEALGLIGPDAQPALKDLLKLLGDAGTPIRVRRAACEAVARIKPEAKEVATAVRLAMRDKDEELRHAAIDAAITVVQANDDPEVLKGVNRAARSDADAEAAAVALRCLGPRGVPPLIDALQASGRPQALVAILHAIRRLGLAAQDARKHVLALAKRWLVKDEVRAAALEALSSFDLLNEEYMKEYAANLGDEGLTGPVEALLTQCGKSAMPNLRQKLKDGSPDARAAAARVLAALGEAAAPAVPELEEALGHKEPPVVRAVLAALDAIGPPAKPAATRLARLLEDPAIDDTQRDAIHLALANIGRGEAQPRYASAFQALSTPKLLDIVREAKTTPARRRGAIRALADRTAEAGAIVPVLLEALKDADLAVRTQAAACLAAFGPAAKPALDTMIDWLGSGDAALQRAALALLAGLGADAQPAVVAMAGFAKAAPVEKDEKACALLGLAMRPHGLDAAPWLAQTVKSGAPEARLRAALVLREVGPAAAVALPDLLEAARADDAALSVAALQAVEAFGSVARESAPALAKLLIHEDAKVREAAVRALGAFGVDPAEGDKFHIVDALIPMLLDPEEDVARAAHSAVVAVGPVTLPRLRELVKLSEGEAPYWALRAFARLRADPDSTIPHLMRLALPGKQPVERGVAAELLGYYAPDRTEAIPLLVRVLGDREEFVAKAAGRSLLAFGVLSLPALDEALRGRDPRARRLALELIETVRFGVKAP